MAAPCSKVALNKSNLPLALVLSSCRQWKVTRSLELLKDEKSEYELAGSFTYQQGQVLEAMPVERHLLAEVLGLSSGCSGCSLTPLDDKLQQEVLESNEQMRRKEDLRPI